MSFPTVANLLDGFNRGAIGANWTTPTYGDVAVVITGGSVLGSSGGFSAGYLNTSSFGPGIEFYNDVVAYPGSSFMGLMYHLNSGGSDAAPNGYEFVPSPTNGVARLERVDAGANTVIGATFTITAAYSVGDRVGVQVDASNIHYFYYQPSGGAWSLIAQRTESTYTSGFFGFELDTGNQVDNMSGGTIISGTAYSGAVTLDRTEGFSADYTFSIHPPPGAAQDYFAFPKVVMRNGGRG